MVEHRNRPAVREFPGRRVDHRAQASGGCSAFLVGWTPDELVFVDRRDRTFAIPAGDTHRAILRTLLLKMGAFRVPAHLDV